MNARSIAPLPAGSWTLPYTPSATETAAPARNGNRTNSRRARGGSCIVAIMGSAAIVGGGASPSERYLCPGSYGRSAHREVVGEDRALGVPAVDVDRHAGRAGARGELDAQLRVGRGR